MPETPPAACTRRVYVDHRDVRGHVCGRPVKDEGLCSIHLAAARRRAAKQTARAQEQQRDAEVEAAARALCDRLAAYGVPAVPHWSGTTLHFTGGLVLEGAAVAGLLDLLEARG
jgi:hypothetical protein